MNSSHEPGSSVTKPSRRRSPGSASGSSIVISRRRPGGNRAAVPVERGHDAGAGRQTLRGAGARGARHLRPRGLLQLPLADDPAAARRNRALRSLFAGRRERLRPSVPVRLQAHRPGPGARRRPLQRRVASRAPDESARRGARVEHAGLSRGSRKTTWTTGGTGSKMRALRSVGVPYTDEDIAAAADAVRGKTEMEALIAYLQGLGTASANW